MKKVVKKVIVFVLMFLALTLTSCGYSREDLLRAKNEGYEAGFEDGYDLAKYEAKGEIERIQFDEVDRAYEAGYELGYENGYYDGLDEQNPDSSHGSRRIEKD